MIELTNYVSKILHNDSDNSYYIVTYTDFDELFESEFIINYVNEIVSKNSTLTRLIVEIDNSFFLDNIKLFNINDYYKIVHTKFENFDSYITTMLNNEITTQLKWQILWCVDEESKKSRFYMKIHHAYVDGYQLIHILMSPFDKNVREPIPKFKRKTDLFETIYYYIIGTIILICLNVRFFFNICFNPTSAATKAITNDFIICKEFNFKEMKSFTRKNNITINDFCYSLMIKTDNLYTNKERLLSTTSPINTSGSSQPNNMCPIFNVISNAYNNHTLLNRIHDTFNAYKYSLFIPMFSYLINTITPFIPTGILSNGYNIIMDKTDYTYSNIIGPSLDGVQVKVSNIRFLTTSKHNEIMFNIISCNNDKINIICSFKTGVISDKARFEQCIYDAYQSLITTY